MPFRHVVLLRWADDVPDDHLEQVRAGPVDGTGELDLPRGEVALRVLRELLPQDEDAVER